MHASRLSLIVVTLLLSEYKHRDDPRRRLTPSRRINIPSYRARASFLDFSPQRNLMVQSTTSLSSGIFRPDGNTRLRSFYASASSTLVRMHIRGCTHASRTSSHLSSSSELILRIHEAHDVYVFSESTPRIYIHDIHVFFYHEFTAIRVRSSSLLHFFFTM